MPSKLNVYIVDDDEPIRDSLSLQLDAAGFAVRSFGSAQGFLAVASALAPGCLVSDIRMPDMDGLELLRVLNERAMPFGVVMMTGYADVPIAVRAMKAGAVDFIEKPFTEDAILDSIALAQEWLARSREESEAAEAARARVALLTEREREVLQGLAAGLPNKTVAYDLGISPRTVEVHRARIMEKLEARNLSHLVRLALAAGIAIES